MRKITMKFLFVSLSLFVFLIRVDAQDVLETKQFGVKVVKPNSWIEATNIDLQNSLSRINFSEEELRKLLNSNKGIVTLTTYYKYRRDSVAGLIPTIKVTIRANPTTNMAEFREVMSGSVDRLKTTLKNFEMVETFKEVNVSGFPSLYYNFRYSLPLASGGNTEVRTRYYMIPKGIYFIIISFMDNEKSDDCTNVFNDFIKNLQLTN